MRLLRYPSFAAKSFFILFFLLSNQPLKAAEFHASLWEFTWGARYWLGNSHYGVNLLGYGPELVSRLTYENVMSNAAEGFWQLNHASGIFLKGYVGGGSNHNGQFVDQDFPPGIDYSRTISKQQNGGLNYFSIDLGYTFYNQPSWKVSAFAGYHYWLEHYNNFGCVQTVGGPVCVNPSIPSTVDGLNDNFTWNSLRLGLVSSLKLLDNLDFILDAAYTRSNLNGNDFHNLRPDIRGIFENGSGNGVQLDATLDWEISRNLTLGIGGRWWYVNTDGYAHFEQTAASGEPQPIELNQSTYGLLIHTSYTFDDSNVWAREKDPVYFNWQGFYAGANIGYGTYPGNVFIYPVSIAAQAIETPSLLNIQSMGFLGGGQAGYNWQRGRFMLGVEADINYAHIGGANATTLTGINSYTTSVSQNLEWLTTLRGRIGTLASDNFLVYLTAGPAWGGTELTFDQRDVGASCALALCSTGDTSQTRIGGVVGGGIEYGVNSKATFKVEYLYANLGNTGLNTYTDTFGNYNYYARSNFSYNLVRLGVNYQFHI